MAINAATLAEEYYRLVGKKDLEGVKQYLHPEIELSSPLGNLKGKEAFIKATSTYMNTFESLKIRTKFGSQDQAMIVYDVDIPGIVKGLPTAVLLSIRDGLIARIELFYDASHFTSMKEKIFS
jgi:hypothetical protein